MQISACQGLYNSAVYFLWPVSFPVFTVSVCSAAGVNFSGEMLEAVAARPSRWCEVVQLHCCPLSHHCGANQCQGRGQLPG